MNLQTSPKLTAMMKLRGYQGPKFDAEDEKCYFDLV